MTNNTAITIEPLENHAAHIVRWGGDANDIVVLNAFKKVARILDRAPRPTTIILDLTDEPHCPLLTILNAVLLGPYYHHHLDEWLVIGDNRIARTIGRILSRNRRKQATFWFNSEVDVIAYMDSRAGISHGTAVDIAHAHGL